MAPIFDHTEFGLCKLSNVEILFVIACFPVALDHFTLNLLYHTVTLTESLVILLVVANPNSLCVNAIFVRVVVLTWQKLGLLLVVALYFR